MLRSVSIIICTRDRAQYLAETLAAFQEIRVLESWVVELIVVDNGSSDNTAVMVQGTSFAALSARYLFVPQGGKSVALNVAIREATGKVLLFTDDDVRPPPDWIEMMCKPILDGECDGVAGGVKLAPHLERPWFEAEHRSFLASTDYIHTEPERRWVGANMAVHRRIFDVIGGFDPELGPGAMGFFDESLLFKQVIKAGFEVRTSFEIKVEHHFDLGRLTRSNFIAAAKKIGRCNAYVNHHWDHISGGLYRDLIFALRSLRVLYRHRFHNLFRAADHVAAWELNAWRAVAFAYSRIIEGRRIRNYDRYGLVKKNGQLPLAAAAPSLEGAPRLHQAIYSLDRSSSC